MVIAAARRLPFRLKCFKQLMIQGQNSPAVEGALQRLRISLTGDVFEHLIDGVPPLEHRIVFPTGADQVRQRELLAREEQLQRVAERHLERIILAASPALKQELSLLADDQKFWRFAGAAGEFNDRVDHPDVEMRHDDRRVLQQ